MGRIRTPPLPFLLRLSLRVLLLRVPLQMPRQHQMHPRMQWRQVPVTVVLVLVLLLVLVVQRLQRRRMPPPKPLRILLPQW